MHEEWDYGPGYVMKFTLRARGRPDAINFESRHVFELKPNRFGWNCYCVAAF